MVFCQLVTHLTDGSFPRLWRVASTLEAEGEGDRGGEIATLEVKRAILVEIVRRVAGVLATNGVLVDVVKRTSVVVAQSERQIHVGVYLVDTIQTHFIVSVDTLVERLLRNGLADAAILAATTKVGIGVELHIVGVTEAEQHATDRSIG